MAETNTGRAAPQGHGGGGGHQPAFAGRVGFRGYYGHYGRYGCWGYPGCVAGFGLGCALGYPYYGYYYDGYPVVVYADAAGYGPAWGPYPPPAYPPAGPVAAAGPVRPTDTSVHFRVRVPPEAAVWFNGFQTTQTGPQREFASSGLEPGRTYTFDIRARWTGPDGHPVDVDRRLTVRGGDQWGVDFTAARAPGGDAPR